MTCEHILLSEPGVLTHQHEPLGSFLAFDVSHPCQTCVNRAEAGEGH
jgi:hypothetical protein